MLKKKDEELVTAKAAVDRIATTVSSVDLETNYTYFLEILSHDHLLKCPKYVVPYDDFPQTNKNSLSENEKRERRAMERKMSEMEEELKVKLLNKQNKQKTKLRSKTILKKKFVTKTKIFFHLNTALFY